MRCLKVQVNLESIFIFLELQVERFDLPGVSGRQYPLHVPFSNCRFEAVLKVYGLRKEDI